jgi:hypothetical protein
MMMPELKLIVFILATLYSLSYAGIVLGISNPFAVKQQHTQQQQVEEEGTTEYTICDSPLSSSSIQEIQP